MTLTGRIRFSLILAALLPPLLVMLSLYAWLDSQAESQHRREATDAVQRFDRYLEQWQDQALKAATELAAAPDVARTVALLEANRTGHINLTIERQPLDFLELVDPNGVCRFSLHRPALIGETIGSGDDEIRTEATVQYDLAGFHAAYTITAPTAAGWSLFTGRYFDSAAVAIGSQLIDAPIELHAAGDADSRLRQMESQQVYQIDSLLQAVLWGGPAAGFYLTTTFDADNNVPDFTSLFYITGAVAVVSVIIAILLGMFFTGRAKREIENLVGATNRVAEGDFTTPVMAYEEGEFSQLADSFSDMMYRLRHTQDKLAVSEKIAAWQAMARKIAHEIKNPLSPIAISADDLRQSYREQLPDFERTLNDTTGTIKNEVRRLTRLLDEFVAFARMAPPEIKTVAPSELLGNLRTLYRSEIESGRLKINMLSRREQLRLDPDSIQRLLVNLIKNALEAGDDVSVSVTIDDRDNDLVLTVHDTGPGFPTTVLQEQFVPYMSTKPQGSGLGLVISQRIAHDHGGRITIENHKDGGGIVTVRLPQHN